MKIVSQLSVFLENKAGVFARVFSAFAKEGINMQGIMVVDAIDHAVVRMVVDKPKKAKYLLEDHGAVCLENDILALEVPNAPGALILAAEKLAKKNINLDYAYGSAPSSDGKGVTIYIHVANPAESIK